MEKVWLKRYPPQVPADVNPDEFRSLVEVFDRSCCQFGRRNAFVNMGCGMTYAELEQMSRAFAAWLQQELRLEKGERVAIMLPNLLQYPVALFGALRAGLVVVNVNPLHTPHELEHQLRDSGAKAILILANFAHRWPRSSSGPRSGPPSSPRSATCCRSGRPRWSIWRPGTSKRKCHITRCRIRLGSRKRWLAVPA